MARPQKTEEALTEPFSFRTGKTVAAALHDKIARSGLSKGEFFRDVALNNKTVVVARPLASLDKKRMQFLFNKTSNNMNQIAHVLNSANTAGRLSESLCKDSLRALEDIAKYLRVALNHVD
jgi:hypothetical protein